MKICYFRMPAVRTRTPLRKPRELITRGLSVMVGCLAAASAQAENPTTSTSLLGDKTKIMVGTGISVLPRYEGSSETRVIPIPVVAMQRGIFFADILRGVGAEYETESGFYISSALGYDEGRARKDSIWCPGSKRLAGMGDVKGSIIFTLEAAQQLTSWLSLTSACEFALEGQKNRGNQYRFGLYAYVRDTKRDTVTLDLNAHAGDRDYSRTYFGVTDAQSQTSNFSRFEAGSGIYGYSLTESWTHRLDDHWSITTAVKVLQLTSDAARSPLVQQKTAVTGLATLNYSF